jgi:L-threonylcarbamoyladenylate synthase
VAHVSGAAAFEACIRGGGVAVFPADTVYGLACDPDDPRAVARLYALKRRPPAKAAAVMYFARAAAFEALPEIEPRTRALLERLLPGPVTVLLPNPRGRWGQAALGLRVPDVPALAAVAVPVLQSSANLSGGADPVTLEEVPAELREGADLVLDGGRLPGLPSTVIDLQRYERTGAYEIVREGAVPAGEIARATS